MQHADLDGRALRAQHGRARADAGRGGAERRGLQEPAAVDGRKLTRHAIPPWCWAEA